MQLSNRRHTPLSLFRSPDSGLQYPISFSFSAFISSLSPFSFFPAPSLPASRLRFPDSFFPLSSFLFPAPRSSYDLYLLSFIFYLTTFVFLLLSYNFCLLTIPFFTPFFTPCHTSSFTHNPGLSKNLWVPVFYKISCI